MLPGGVTKYSNYLNYDRLDPNDTTIIDIIDSSFCSTFTYKECKTIGIKTDTSMPGTFVIENSTGTNTDRINFTTDSRTGVAFYKLSDGFTSQKWNTIKDAQITSAKVEFTGGGGLDMWYSFMYFDSANIVAVRNYEGNDSFGNYIQDGRGGWTEISNYNSLILGA